MVMPEREAGGDALGEAGEVTPHALPDRLERLDGHQIRAVTRQPHEVDLKLTGNLPDDLRGGSGNLDKGAEWSFCLMAARMAAEQERR